MTDKKYIFTVICLCLCSMFYVISADQVCDKSKCKGPVQYYNDLRCTPIYGPEDTCCAVKYNCDHLKGRSKDKCYYKGHKYEINEKLRSEDAKPCEKLCFCVEGWQDFPAHFTCAIVDCFNRPRPGCYMKHTHDRCCPGPQVCAQNGNQTIARCEVDGKTYLDGQRFTPQSDSTLSCICSEGYTGENVAPFCKPVEPRSCSVELRRGADIYQNCAPVFESSQNPATDCQYSSRCQNGNDRIVESENATVAEGTSVSDPGSTCSFGQLTLKIGDQLNAGTDYSSVCVKCVCEVPPIPTCRRLPDSECDVTAHANFR